MYAQHFFFPVQNQRRTFLHSQFVQCRRCRLCTTTICRTSIYRHIVVLLRIRDAPFVLCHFLLFVLLATKRVRGDRFRDLLRIFREAGAGQEDAKLQENDGKARRHVQQAPVQHQLEAITAGVCVNHGGVVTPNAGCQPSQ